MIRVLTIMMLWCLINLFIVIIGYFNEVNTIWYFFVGWFIFWLFGLKLAIKQDKKRKKFMEKYLKKSNFK